MRWSCFFYCCCFDITSIRILQHYHRRRCRRHHHHHRRHRRHHHNHNNNHHHLVIMQFGHLLTRSALTYWSLFNGLPMGLLALHCFDITSMTVRFCVTSICTSISLPFIYFLSLHYLQCFDHFHACIPLIRPYICTCCTHIISPCILYRKPPLDKHWVLTYGRTTVLPHLTKCELSYIQ
jgi:hypothetical protein